MTIAVRRAVPTDIDWLVSELREFAEFFNSRHSLMGDEEYARTGLGEIINKHFCLVATKDDTPVGLVAAYQLPHPFNPKIRLLSEMFWWVSPGARGSGAGAKLLDALIEYGKANVDWITVAIEEKSPIKPENLEKRGFRLTERSFLLEVN